MTVFGFTAAIFERLPLVGILFSISNRIGAAMWAFDLEKQQQYFSSGRGTPTQVYKSKTAQIVPSDLPESFAGGFPKSKVDIDGVLIEDKAQVVKGGIKKRI